MLCCFKRPWKSSKPGNRVLNTSEDHVQNPGSQSSLPLKTLSTSEQEVSDSRAASPAKAEPEKLQQGSSDSNQSEVVNCHENVFTIEGPRQSQYQSSDPNISGVGTYKAATATTQHRPSPAEGAVAGMSKLSKPDEELLPSAKQNRDLWKEAAEKLSEDKQKLLSMIKKEEGAQVVERVAKQTELSYPEHGKRKWKTVFESALSSVLTCKGLISSAADCDPTGHAAAAWTVVSLGLMMAQNELDRRQNVLKACGLLAGNLGMMAAFEASYRKKVMSNQTDLEDTIVDVYVAILELSAEIVRENSASVVHKILNSFNKLADQPLQRFKETLTEAHQKLSQWTGIIDQQYRIRLAENVSSMLAEMEEMTKKVSVVTASVLTKEEENILDWLSQYPFHDSHRDAVNRRKRGTGDWILILSEYETWKKSEGSLLWLHGNSQYTSLRSLLY